MLIDTDMVIEVLGVTDAIAATAITTATVLVTLLDDSDDTEIGGVTWPLTLVHDTGGDYRVTLPDTMVLSPCVQCKAQLSIDDGAGLYREWETLYPAAQGTIAASIFIDNTDHVVTVDGLKRAVPDTFINAGTVAITLKDLSDVDIAGETWPLALAYVAASDGKYRATLRDTLDVADGDAVKVLITADDRAGYHREWRSILTIETGT